MAPSRKNARKTLKKKVVRVKVVDKKKEETNSSSSPIKLCSSDDLLVSKKMDHEISTIGCTTPKAQKYKIPNILTCPPAPKKRRVGSSCSLRRAPISFFDPPDIELFFASHLVSVYNHVNTHVYKIEVWEYYVSLRRESCGSKEDACVDTYELGVATNVTSLVALYC